MKTGYRKGDLNHILNTEIFYLTISIKQTNKSFLTRWEIPRLEANGVITGFVIQFGLSAEKGQAFIPDDSREFDPSERQGTIEDLVPGQNYTFQIQAKTRVGYGQVNFFKYVFTYLTNCI